MVNITHMPFLDTTVIDSSEIVAVDFNLNLRICKLMKGAITELRVSLIMYLSTTERIITLMLTNYLQCRWAMKPEFEE